MIHVLVEDNLKIKPTLHVDFYLLTLKPIQYVLVEDATGTNIFIYQSFCNKTTCTVSTIFQFSTYA